MNPSLYVPSQDEKLIRLEFQRYMVKVSALNLLRASKRLPPVAADPMIKAFDQDNVLEMFRGVYPDFYAQLLTERLNNESEPKKDCLEEADQQ